MTNQVNALITVEQAKAEAQESIVEALQAVEIAEGFTIATQEDAELAAQQLSAIAKFIKVRDARRLEITRPYDTAKSDIKAAFDEPIEKAREADKLLRQMLLNFQNEQEKIAEQQRIEQQRKLDKERQETTDRLAAESAKLEKLKTPEARAKAEARVDDLATKAEELEFTAPTVAAPAKIAGFSARKNWIPEIAPDAKDKIIAGIIDGNADLRQYLIVDEKMIARMVKVQEANTKIPGVRAVNRPSAAVR